MRLFSLAASRRPSTAAAYRAARTGSPRLGLLIRDADTVVFVLSPLARSDVCAWEVAEAVRLGKRVIPVLYRALKDAKPPRELADRDYIYFYAEPKFPGSGVGPGLLRLAAALNTDLDWLREHTRYLRLATEWEEVGKPPDRRLLSAADITLAKTWAASRPAKAADLTALQREFIGASEAEDTRQAKAKAEAEIERREAAEQTAAEAKKAAEARKHTAQVAVGGLAAALLVAGLAVWQYVAANEARKDALVQRDRALHAEGLADKEKKEAQANADQARASSERANANLSEAQIAQSRYFSDLAFQLRKTNNPLSAALLALESLPNSAVGVARPYVPEAELQLDGAPRALREQIEIHYKAPLWSAEFSPNGKLIVTASHDNTARFGTPDSGNPVGKFMSGHEGPVYRATFSPDGKRVVTASDDRTARIWDAESGKQIGEALKGHQDAVYSAAYSPDGQRILTASRDQTVRIWDAKMVGQIGEPLTGHKGVRWAAFSPDGKCIVTASMDGTARGADV